MNAQNFRNLLTFGLLIFLAVLGCAQEKPASLDDNNTPVSSPMSWACGSGLTPQLAPAYLPIGNTADFCSLTNLNSSKGVPGTNTTTWKGTGDQAVVTLMKKHVGAEIFTKTAAGAYGQFNGACVGIAANPGKSETLNPGLAPDDLTYQAWLGSGAQSSILTEGDLKTPKTPYHLVYDCKNDNTKYGPQANGCAVKIDDDDTGYGGMEIHYNKLIQIPIVEGDGDPINAEPAGINVLQSMMPAASMQYGPQSQPIALRNNPDLHKNLQAKYHVYTGVRSKMRAKFLSPASHYTCMKADCVCKSTTVNNVATPDTLNKDNNTCQPPTGPLYAADCSFSSDSDDWGSNTESPYFYQVGDVAGNTFPTKNVYPMQTTVSLPVPLQRLCQKHSDCNASVPASGPAGVPWKLFSSSFTVQGIPPNICQIEYDAEKGQFEEFGYCRTVAITDESCPGVGWQASLTDTALCYYDFSTNGYSCKAPVDKDSGQPLKPTPVQPALLTPAVYQVPKTGVDVPDTANNTGVCVAVTGTDTATDFKNCFLPLPLCEFNCNALATRELCEMPMINLAPPSTLGGFSAASGNHLGVNAARYQKQCLVDNAGSGDDACYTKNLCYWDEKTFGCRGSKLEVAYRAPATDPATKAVTATEAGYATDFVSTQKVFYNPTSPNNATFGTDTVPALKYQSPQLIDGVLPASVDVKSCESSTAEASNSRVTMLSASCKAHPLKKSPSWAQGFGTTNYLVEEVKNKLAQFTNREIKGFVNLTQFNFTSGQAASSLTLDDLSTAVKSFCEVATGNDRAICVGDTGEDGYCLVQCEYDTDCGGNGLFCAPLLGGVVNNDKSNVKTALSIGGVSPATIKVCQEDCSQRPYGDCGEVYQFCSATQNDMTIKPYSADQVQSLGLSNCEPAGGKQCDLEWVQSTGLTTPQICSNLHVSYQNENCGLLCEFQPYSNFGWKQTDMIATGAHTNPTDLKDICYWDPADTSKNYASGRYIPKTYPVPENCASPSKNLIGAGETCEFQDDCVWDPCSCACNTSTSHFTFRPSWTTSTSTSGCSGVAEKAACNICDGTSDYPQDRDSEIQKWAGQDISVCEKLTNANGSNDLDNCVIGTTCGKTFGGKIGSSQPSCCSVPTSIDTVTFPGYVASQICSTDFYSLTQPDGTKPAIDSTGDYRYWSSVDLTTEDTSSGTAYDDKNAAYCNKMIDCFGLSQATCGSTSNCQWKPESTANGGNICQQTAKTSDAAACERKLEADCKSSANYCDWINVAEDYGVPSSVGDASVKPDNICVSRCSENTTASACDSQATCTTNAVAGRCISTGSYADGP